MMKNKLTKTIFMTILFLSIIVSNISLTFINAQENENILINEDEEDSIFIPNENIENEEIIESNTPIWDEIGDVAITYSGKRVEIDEPTYTIGSTNGNKADKVSYHYASKDGTYNSETAPKDAGEYTVSIEASIDDYPDNIYKKSVNITIKKAHLIISADNKSIKQDENLPIATYSINGFVNDESEDVFTLNTLNAVYQDEDTSIEGKYIISMTGEIIANNYDYELVDGMLDIVKKDIIIEPDKENDVNNKEYAHEDNALSVEEENPKTGENSNILVYSAMALFSGCGMFFMSGKDSW